MKSFEQYLTAKTIVAKLFDLDVCGGPDYASDQFHKTMSPKQIIARK